VPLSEGQKAMLLKDTSGVVQSSLRASDVASGKLPSDSTHFNFDPIQPPPLSQPIISEPIPLPPSQSITINPIT
jgi:hypothetical protein